MSDLFALARPLLHRLDPERAHNLTLAALRLGLMPAADWRPDPILATRLFGRMLACPIGLAAGFDKQALVFRRMARLGFGFVEVGGVTPRPQPGNPKPRLFRLKADRAVINRMGFNNVGLELAARRVGDVGDLAAPLGVNLASNSDSADPGRDFATLVRRLAPLADYLVVDVSCPNTANGKLFQRADKLRPLLADLMAIAAEAARAEIWIKVAPDLDAQEIADIAGVAVEAAVAGIILTNTTLDRPAGLADAAKGERGGLSGRPLFQRATAVLAAFRHATAGRLPLIGVGGVEDGATAYAKIRAGASAVQIYTALVYGGPAVVRRTAEELAAMIRRDGFATLTDAVGADVPLNGDGRVAA
jgi:dihydroorotate dehydrogenase